MSSTGYFTASSPMNVEFLNVKDEPFRWHNSIEVVIVLEGSIHIAIADEQRTLGADAIEIFNINQVHRLWQTDENNVVLQINIDAEFAKAYFPDLSYVWFAHEFSPGACLGIERVEGVIKSICTLITPIVATREMPFLTLKNTAEQLLDLLIMNFDAKRMFEGNPTKLQRIGRIYDYLFNNTGFINKASLNDIAKHTEEYLNLDYLSSQFKLLIGDTLQNLLHYLRIEHAIKQLLTTDQSLLVISIESGFSSPRYFYQRFNKIFPEGPKAFREQHQKKQKMKEHCREIIDPALVLTSHRGLFEIPETVNSELNKRIHIDIFGPNEQYSTSLYLIKVSELVKGDSQAYLKMILQVNTLSPNNVFGFEETLDTANRDDFQVLTWMLNQFRENDISPVFIIGTSSNAISEQITTIQGLLQNYTLSYGAEHMKGWRIELQ
ncbi:helix-turn-helix domain-containing protein [Paenibacillus xylanexedens]|uniref:AraC family transcriptional regulator n=1 Tax=Paenibacillus xylanexedens TaxID=528191 RepID=UPI0011A88685|nr:helix-turn-helix domain-containing protein [Paenibacillus xylanexedens]